MGVSFCDAHGRALRYSNTVMLLQLVRHTAKGVVGTKVGDGALQRSGVAPASDVRRGGKRSAKLAVSPIKVGLFGNANFTEGAVPVEFLLPVERTRPSFPVPAILRPLGVAPSPLAGV